MYNGIYTLEVRNGTHDAGKRFRYIEERNGDEILPTVENKATGLSTRETSTGMLATS